MKLWIKIVPNGQPGDGEGTWLEVDFVPVPAADGKDILWQFAKPSIPDGFRIVAVNEDGPNEKRPGGGGN